MAKIKRLKDGLTGEVYYKELKNNRDLRRITAGLAWPTAELPGALAVIGESRYKQNVVGGLHELYILQEFESSSLTNLIEEARLFQQVWLPSSWLTPISDQRIVLLEDANDEIRKEGRRTLRYNDPQGWKGDGEGLIPFYYSLVKRRTEKAGIKSLFFGQNSPAANDLQRLSEKDMHRKVTDFPSAAAALFCIAEFDLNKIPEESEKLSSYIGGPADLLGGY